MKEIATLVFIASVALSSTTNAADSKSVLADLGKALRHARSSPIDAKLNSSCPNKLSELVGLSKKEILDALGNPDLNEDVVSRGSDPFSLLHYYLTPGATTVTFEVGSGNVITSVSCK
jgi:hypothetical protein